MQIQTLEPACPESASGAPSAQLPLAGHLPSLCLRCLPGKMGMTTHLPHKAFVTTK